MNNNESSDPNAYLWAEGARLIAKPAEKSVSNRPAPVPMTDAVRRELRRKYDDWRAQRSTLSHREDSFEGDSPSADDWHTNDDAGTELYGELASYLFGVDDCGHQNVTVWNGDVDDADTSVYKVTCDDCPEFWMVRDGTVPQVDTWADGYGNWHAKVTEYGVGNSVTCQADALAAITRELVERGIDPAAIAARMVLEQVARTSQHGKLETEFVETWKHPEA